MNKKLLFSFLFLIASIVIGVILVGDTPNQGEISEGFLNIYGKEPIPVKSCNSEECALLGIYSKFFNISTTQWYSEDAFIEYSWINQEEETQTGYINKKHLSLEPYSYTQKDLGVAEERYLVTPLDIKEHPWEESRTLGKTPSQGYFEIPQYVLEQGLEYLFINQDTIEGFIPLNSLKEQEEITFSQTPTTTEYNEPQYQPEIETQSVPKENSPDIKTSNTTYAPNLGSIEERTIVPEGVVHMVCYFESTHPTTYFRMIFEGSGAIIDPAGYILTARHVVDPQYTAKEHGTYLTEEQKDKYSVLKLEYCEVGVPSVPETNPAEEILTNMKLPYQYIAHEVINPSSLEGLSEEEIKYLDISILKIDSLNPEFANNYKNLQLPKEFPHNPILELTPPSKEDLLSYSYPAYWQTNYRDFINLKRHTAVVDQIHFGYKKFSNTPILYSINVEGAFGSATSFGSSGSPVFWRGYIAGTLVSQSSGLDRFFVVSPETIEELLKSGNINK